MQPLEIIVKGDSSQANVALQKTQQEVIKTGIAVKKTEEAISTFSRNGATSMFTLTERIKAFQAAVFTEKDRGKIAIYNAEIKATEVELAKLQTIGASSGNAIATGAGKAFSAVRQLAYILPGVGIAGIIGFATEPIVKYISKLFEATEAEKKLVAAQKEFNDSVSKDYGKEAASLEVLRASIESVSVPMEKRLQAIKDLKKEFPGLFDGLSNEELLTGRVANAYDLAAAAILRKARASAAAAQLEKIASEKLKISEQDQKDYAETLDKIAKAKASSFTIAGGTFGTSTSGSTTKEEAKKLITEQFNIRNKARQQELDALKKQEDFYLKIAVEGADRVIQVEKKKVEKIKKVRAELSKPEQLKFLGDVSNDPTQLSRASGSTLKPTVNIEPKLQVNITDKEQKKILDAFDKFILNEKLKEAITGAITTLINDTISTTADAVADALAGGKDVVPRLFDNIIKGIGQQIKELGQYLVKIGIEKLAIDKAIKALGLNPAATIAVGFAAQILGSLLISAAQGKSNKVGQGFATGTRNSPAGSFLVGERGPERIFLPSGSAVQPNNELTAYGGGNQTITVVGEISGDVIKLIQDRTTQRWNRNN